MREFLVSIVPELYNAQSTLYNVHGLCKALKMVGLHPRGLNSHGRGRLLSMSLCTTQLGWVLQESPSPLILASKLMNSLLRVYPFNDSDLTTNIFVTPVVR